MKTHENMPDAELNRIFMDGLREFLGMDTFSQSSQEKQKRAKLNKSGQATEASK